VTEPKVTVVSREQLEDPDGIATFEIAKVWRALSHEFLLAHELPAGEKMLFYAILDAEHLEAALNDMAGNQERIAVSAIGGHAVATLATLDVVTLH
jgi:hypothetical protein